MVSANESSINIDLTKQNMKHISGFTIYKIHLGMHFLHTTLSFSHPNNALNGKL